MKSQTQNALRFFALASFGTVVLATGVRTACWIEQTGSACQGIPVQVGQCPVEILQDGDCPFTQLVERGALNRTQSSQTCIYQKKKKDDQNQCTINDGAPVSYVRTCYSAGGPACP